MAQLLAAPKTVLSLPFFQMLSVVVLVQFRWGCRQPWTLLFPLDAKIFVSQAATLKEEHLLSPNSDEFRQ
jgi:hypothetical protein